MSKRSAKYVLWLCLALSAGVLLNALVQPSRASRVVLAASEAAAPGDAGGKPAAGGVDADATSKPSKTVAAHKAEKATPASVRRLAQAIERELMQKGYETGVVDGEIDALTRAGIMAYEHDAKLPLTGEIREGLLKQLLMGGGEERARGKGGDGPFARKIVLGTERLLRKVGYKPGPVDGVITAETRAAIRQFETDEGLAATGRVSGLLLLALARRLGTEVAEADPAFRS